ncbi:type II CRISPR RNA-guided endonuclease Cas9 [Alloscardovia theropitheci]|uniref:CRISPR-associated endonuclease Cas9 n=1 Tax=Alloscardovia theropitheci TaxID=2496842 RepID=A0A4R0QXR8_9BIFI|nr:type II CRISPR RNA-guided endonuclease Cas9 [Alloscardovia theropitheci]TCD54450.1 type II CRISPR RNA-guided endonuclease Cas9 [Alloscardovia theropitheci]
MTNTSDNNIIDYAMGLDLGNASVGWVAMGTDYRLKRARGKELIGARLFNPANTAADRRMHRAMRRRLSRRRWRLRMLDELFATEITKIDPEFFVRRKYSWVHPKDELNHTNWHDGMIFRTKEQDQQFYKDYPTIYHLRQKLMEDTAKHDIREVYLAIHHIIKFRGNFLTEGTLDIKNVFDQDKACKLFGQILSDNIGEDSQLEAKYTDSSVSLVDILLTPGLTRKTRAENALKGFTIHGLDNKFIRGSLESILSALLGNQINFIKIFGLLNLDKDTKEVLKFKFGDKDYDEKIQKVIDVNVLSDNQIEYVNELKRLHDSLLIRELLGESKTFSAAQIRRYQTHKDNLKLFDGIRMGFGKEQEKEFLLQYRNLLSSKEDKNKDGREYFSTLIKKLADEEKRDKLQIDLEENKLFPKQRTSINVVIPHQLHLNELQLIILNQGKYYPFLLDKYVKDGKEENKIEGLLKFRIPYYVGPLVSRNDRNDFDNHDYHWMVRNEGRTETITPWNFDEVVDKDKSGIEFINRLKTTDTFLAGEYTLPKHSMLYEKYMLLSELNNVSLEYRDGNTVYGSEQQKLSTEDKQYLIDKLFKHYKVVTKKRVEEQLMLKHGAKIIKLRGLADEEKFTSSLESYINLQRTFPREFLDNKTNQEFLERIIELQTVFEDRDPLKHQLSLMENLTSSQIEQLVRTHYTGWGRLSHKFLTTRCVSLRRNPEKCSIMDALEQTSLSLMSLVRQSKYGVNEWIESQNSQREYSSNPEERLAELIDALLVSPKVKRGIYQTIRVIDDVSRALGSLPRRIFIETSDEAQVSVRSKSRKTKLQNLLDSDDLRKEFWSIRKELEKEKQSLKDDKLYLYYSQLQMDMYTGEKLSIDDLRNCDIDHIIPRAITKNDSLSNRVLVRKSVNSEKSDSQMYLPNNVISRMKSHWSYLLKMGLISEEKYKALTRSKPYGEELERFINRSMVDTRQIIKNVERVVSDYYGEEAKIDIYPINSEVTIDMRKYLGYEHKNRDINDYHHAQDALCIAAAGQFMVNSGIFNRIQGTVNNGKYYNAFFEQYFADIRARETEKYRENISRNRRIKIFGFVVGSMCSVNAKYRMNPITGRIVWAQSDANYLRKVMNYKKILITQRVGADKHSLYKVERISHKKSQKGMIPLDKARINTKLYGGFKTPTTASMLLIYHQNEVMLVSVHEAENILMRLNKEQALTKILCRNRKNDAKILLDNILPGQLLVYANQLVTVRSATEFNNAVQLWLPKVTYDIVDTLVDPSFQNKEQCLDKLRGIFGEDFDYDSALQMSFETIMDIANRRFPLISRKVNKIESSSEILLGSEFKRQREALISVLKGLHANSAYTKLGEFGLGSEWGRIRNHSGGYVLDDSDEFIYQSPSGIFETRVSIAELKRRAGIE